ncbi:MAG TPA: hypothetical protein VGR57_12880 [Ktedonobacterales bacterium]|nr:hypothetical protein [Ktedonobacterales bacterium]
MESAGTGGEPSATFALRDGGALRIGAAGVTVGDSQYRFAEIGAVWRQLADPSSLALQLTDARLVPVTFADATDVPRALAALYRWRGAPPPPIYGPAGAYPPYPFWPPPYGYPPPPPAIPGMPAGYHVPPFPPVPPAGQGDGGARRGGIGLWPQDIGSMLRTIFRLYFQNFWRFAVLGLLTALWPALLSGGWVVAYFYALGLDPFQNLYSQLAVGADGYRAFSANAPLFHLFDLSPAQVALLLLAAVAWLVLLLVLSSWQTAALAVGVREGVAGRPVKIGAALRAGVGRLLPVLGTTLLIGLIFFGIYLIALGGFFGVVFLVVAIPAGSGQDASLSFLLLLPVFIVLWALIVCAGVYLGIRLGFGPYAAACDRLSPGRAIARSWSVTRRNWWRTFVVLLLAGLASGVVAGLGSSAQVISIGVQALIATPLLTALVAPLTTVAYVVLYYDLRLRREGYPAIAGELGLAGVFASPPPSPPAS